MSQVVSLAKGKSFSSKNSDPRLAGVVEDSLFAVGVLATVALPPVIYCANGGPVPPSVFLACAIAGVIIGFIKSNTSSDAPPSIFD